RRGAAPVGRTGSFGPDPRRGADGRHLLSRPRAGRRALRRGGGSGRPRPDAVHPRSDEADERGEVGGGRHSPRGPRPERAAGGVRSAALRARAVQWAPPRRSLTSGERAGPPPPPPPPALLYRPARPGPCPPGGAGQ